MHVLVDASILKPGLGGIATYAEGIVRELAGRPGVQVSVATSRPERFAALPAVRVVRLRPGVRGFARRLLWRERALGALARRVGADVVLAVTIELPLRVLPVPSLVVVHDVGPLHAPELYGRSRRARFRLLLGPVLRRASAIACVSRATRAALLAQFPDLESRTAVAREGPRILGGGAWEPATPPYVLYVGPLLAHKNVDTLVTAFGLRDLAGVQLRIAGAASDRDRARLQLRAAAVGALVDQLGAVGDAELARLYAGAHAVALPSLHEGFGLPLLEALAAGVPVVASGIDAHIEVAGAGALLVSAPRDPDAWAAALGACVIDPRAARARTDAAARERVAHYTWRGAGDDLLAQLETITRR